MNVYQSQVAMLAMKEHYFIGGMKRSLSDVKDEDYKAAKQAGRGPKAEDQR